MIERFALDFLNHNQRVFVIDGYLGWDKEHRLKIRTYAHRSYHALFMKNMLIEPTKE